MHGYSIALSAMPALYVLLVLVNQLTVNPRAKVLQALDLACT